ncbi:MAG: hypothetical protein H8E31_11550 [Planctomycetes bacterium]|nr:hypothetical protein [Planctomycetota bacterium]
MRRIHQARVVLVKFEVYTDAPMNFLNDKVFLELGLAEAMIPHFPDGPPICEVMRVKAKQPPKAQDRRRR